MSVKFSNNGKTVLSSGISASDTTIPVTDASVFPTITGSEYFYVTLADDTNVEIVKVTAVSSNDLTVTRAQEGTTARAFASGDKAENRLTAGSLTDIVGGISSDIVEKQFTSDSALQAGQPCALKSNGNISSIGGGGTLAASTGNFLEVNAPGDPNGGLKDGGRLNLAYDGDYGIMLGVDDGDGDKTFYQVFSLSGTTISAVGNSTIAQSHGSFFPDAIVYDSSLQKYVCAGRQNNAGTNTQSHAYYITLDSSGSATVSSAFESTPHNSTINYDPAMVTLGDGRQVLFFMDMSSELNAQVLTCNGTDITYSAPVIIDPNGRNRPFIVKKISGGKIIVVYNSDAISGESTEDIMACVITPAATGTSLSVGTPFKIHGGHEGNDNLAADVSDNGKVLIFARPGYYADGVVDNPQAKWRAYVTDVSGTSFGSVTMTDNLGDSRLGDVTWDSALGQFVYTYREDSGSTFKLGRRLVDIGSNNSVIPSAELLFNSGAIKDTYIQTLGLGSGKYITAFMENQGSESLRSGFLVARQESLTLPGAPVADYIGINKTAVAEAGTATVVLAGIAPANASLVVGDDYWITNLGVFQNSDSGYQKVGKAISSSELILDPFGDLDTDTTYTAGTGLSLTGTEFANTAPDQTVTLTGAGATSISGTYPNFTITSTDTNDHASAGYLTSYTETDPVFSAHAASGVTSTKISNWDTAYSWGNHASAGYITGNQTITLSGDVSGSGTTSINVTIADDSHNHVISNVDGLQTALDAKLASSSYTAADVLTKIKTVDGSGSGLDADLLDGQHGSYYYSSANLPSKIKAGGTGPSAENLNTIANSVSTGQLEYRGFNSSSSNAPPVSDNANGVITVGQHSGNYNAQLAFSSNGNMYWRDNPSSSFGSWRKLWDSENDGAGSGLDADTVDGLQASQFLRSDATDTMAGGLRVTGGSYSSGVDTGNIGIAIDKGEFIYSDDGNYLRIIAGHNSAGKIQIGQSGTSLITGIDLYSGTSGNNTLTLNGNKIWNAGNDGSGSGLDADTVDGLQASSLLRADADDTFSGALTSSNRSNGIFGTYDSYKTDHIWSIGTGYKNNSAGSDFGNLYGLAYKHTNNSTGGTMGDSHQMVWCHNGSPKCSLGTNIWTSGNVTAYSDIRVKTNIELIPNALDKVSQLNGYTFNRTDVTFDEHGKPETPVRQTGVIAQEVLEVLPEAVLGSEEGHYSVAYGNMVGLLIEAIKELKAEIDELKAAKS